MIQRLKCVFDINTSPNLYCKYSRVLISEGKYSEETRLSELFSADHFITDT